jgi:dolichol-phosphate mannosyltransferase
VILPTYDEADNLGRLVRGVRRPLPEARVPRGRRQLARRAPGALATSSAARSRSSEVLHRPDKAGARARLRHGFAPRAARRRGLRRRDGRRPLATTRRPAAAARGAEAGADLVLGSRYVPGGGVEDWDLLRRCSRAAAAATRAPLLGVGVRDLTGRLQVLPLPETLRAIDFETVRSGGATPSRSS